MKFQRPKHRIQNDALQNALIPRELDHRVQFTCWLTACATFLGLSFYEAYALLVGGPPPGEHCEHDAVMDINDLEEKLRKLGFVRGRIDYMNANEPRIVIGAFRVFRRGIHTGYWETLHAVVWNSETKIRLDPSEYDTLFRRKAKIVRVFRRIPDAAPIVTGVTIPKPVTNPRDQALHLAA